MLQHNRRPRYLQTDTKRIVKRHKKSSCYLRSKSSAIRTYLQKTQKPKSVTRKRAIDSFTCQGFSAAPSPLTSKLFFGSLSELLARRVQQTVDRLKTTVFWMSYDVARCSTREHQRTVWWAPKWRLLLTCFISCGITWTVLTGWRHWKLHL